ncbi:nucleotidyltransferase domain-containing protein [Clostridium luticellarii]|jgi:predicted nucleotidyltransferase|uniref:Nucleotidyltransferase domain protein n=1 Tax=Clostridium luticellarii TaxID=1691940 RepID=A0A2T0BLJ6_9CLOT|nr:nucleotidyltransferase domain-containing protein [Clostridium luticellarii]MCI1944306.1 nucleotidyltransferase domain-containing protein [Clostridium luticellarii]MCI1967802.1 nucleotidyltransferase domain-containing protein [Clostridium luticellarii]MCI1994680.1 nucleotidyltransferase domain-containing protein [Clostridium luticellarii]MCI2038823.1 nucleotidyltransferase domain-containing protein [Clostridium luticellarii]PRR84770.1 Nucleotidyltransferase domain protein [Clostridium lutice
MERTILQYQKAFNISIERLRANDSILAVMVFGSMITGDLWDESDIDLLVVYKNNMDNVKNLYTEEANVPIHVKLMSKSNFLQLPEQDLKGGFIHRIISSSRLIFSKDMEITSKYDVGRYYPDLDRERWNMFYLGELFKDMSICKKYLQNDGIHTSYIAAVRSIEEFSKLCVNSSGHMVSKDAMTMAMNLNNDFKVCVDNLFFSDAEKVNEAIKYTMDYLKKNVDKNIRNITKILLNYMREKDCFLSSEDIKNDELFYNYNINMEEILSELWKRDIIKKESRDYKMEDDTSLFKENVYFI